MFLNLIFFIIGFYFLIKGSDILISGSSSLAKKLKVSDLVIGLTVVAFGTSAPEFIISALASWRGQGDISFGNVIGSNIFNTLLILGLAAIVSPLIIKKNTSHKEIPFSLLTAVVLLIMANDKFLNNGVDMLGRGDGLILILFFIVFLFYAFATSKSEVGTIKDAEEIKVKIYNNWLTFIMIIGGLAGLFLGGKFVVDGAVDIAKFFGLSEKLIGLTIIAIGTSLPELFASVMAAKRGNSDIAIGNIVGSSIFNIFWILGFASLLNPMFYNPVLNIDLIFLIGITILLFFLIFTGKKSVLSRREGLILIALFFGYFTYLIIRG